MNQPAKMRALIATSGEVKGLVSEVLDELAAAEGAWPGWPQDAIHGAAVLAEEAGEVVQAALQLTYRHAMMTEGQRTQREHLREELLQTAAMALRNLVALDRWGSR